MSSYKLEPNDVVMIRGSLYDCQGRGPGGKYIFVAHSNRSPLYLSPEQVYEYYAEGKFRRLDPGTAAPAVHNPTDYKFDISSLPSHENPSCRF